MDFVSAANLKLITPGPDVCHILHQKRTIIIMSK